MFHWPRMSADVKTHVHTCATCQANKGPLLHYLAAIADLKVGVPMGRVTADVVGPFPLSRQENRYILVLVDYFTRWVEAFPLPDQRADKVAQVVMRFICRFSAPLELHTDQGRNFESTLFGEVCKLLEIHRTQITAYHPSSNGLVESIIRWLPWFVAMLTLPQKTEISTFLSLPWHCPHSHRVQTSEWVRLRWLTPKI